MPKILQPDYNFMLLTEIRKEWLKRHNYKAIILDVDNTFLSRDKREPIKEHLTWLNGLVIEGYQIVLLSNNGGKRLAELENQIGLPIITWAAKPLPIAFWRAMNKFASDTPNENILVVGDQIFTDVLGAHLVGLKVAWVKPLDGSEFIVTNYMRRLEKLVIKEQVITEFSAEDLKDENCVNTNGNS